MEARGFFFNADLLINECIFIFLHRKPLAECRGNTLKYALSPLSQSGCENECACLCVHVLFLGQV